MKTPSTMALIAIAGLPLVAAQPDLAKLPPPAEKQGVTYEKDIRPLFEASCFGCHSRRAQRVRADLRLDTLEDVIKGSEDGKILMTGKSKDSLLVLAVSQLDDETAMPPKRPERPTGLMGRGGFGPGMLIAGPMMTQADKNHDKKLTRDEFTNLADTWFEKLDSDKTGKLDQQQIREKFSDVLAPPDREAAQLGDGSPPDRFRGFNPAGFIGPMFFSAADANKDNSLTQSELKSTFAKWFTEWDTNKVGSLSEEELREGLNTALPRNMAGNFGAGAEITTQMFSIGDKDKDKKLTREELLTVADTWFDKFDTNKTGKVTQAQFVALSTEVFPRQQGMFGGFGPGGGGQRGGGPNFAGPGRGGDGPRRPDPNAGESTESLPPGPRAGGQRGGDQPPNFGGAFGGGQRGGGLPGGFGGGPGGFGGPGGPGAGRSFAPGLFSALDADKDGSLTKSEAENSLAKWLADWDVNKAGFLTEDNLREKLNAMLPRPQFGGFGGPQGPGGPGGPGPGGRGDPADSGSPRKPLTPEQVGLVRAWIDQGAK